MWTITITDQDHRIVTTAHAVTRADARAWAAQFVHTGERATIVPPFSSHR